MMQPWSKFGVKWMIWSQVISILVIFHKSHWKFGQTMENSHFRETRRVISRQRIELFQFRKKRQLMLISLYRICEN